jgi:hypothetical protein
MDKPYFFCWSVGVIITILVIIIFSTITTIDKAIVILNNRQVQIERALKTEHNIGKS